MRPCFFLEGLWGSRGAVLPHLWTTPLSSSLSPVTIVPKLARITLPEMETLEPQAVPPFHAYTSIVSISSRAAACLPGLLAVTPSSARGELESRTMTRLKLSRRGGGGGGLIFCAREESRYSQDKRLSIFRLLDQLHRIFFGACVLNRATTRGAREEADPTPKTPKNESHRHPPKTPKSPKSPKS